MSIRLVRLDPDLERALAQDAHYRDASAREDWPALAGAMQRVAGDFVRNTTTATDEAAWGGFLAVDDASGDLIGSCGFKSPPTADGVIEIAYFTYPGFEGRGYATAMARELIRRAAAAPDVCRVIAHTLRERNASTRVLERVGMTFAGEVVDPDDGLVWRWETEVR